MMKQLEQTSHLFGSNAPFIEEQYENYLADPTLGVRRVARLFRQAAGPGRRRRARRAARSGHRRLRADGQARPGAHHRLRRWRGQAAGLRAAADQRLPLPRQPLGQPRPAQAHRAPADRRARAVLLRLHRGRSLQELQRRLLPRLQHRARHPARDPRGAAPDLLRPDRRRVHVHDRHRSEALDPEPPREPARHAEVLRGDEEAHPRAHHRRRDPRALPAHPLRRPEALLARRRRVGHRRDGRADPRRRQPGRAGNRDRHGPPRPPQRAGQHPGQVALDAVLASSRARPPPTSPPAT